MLMMKENIIENWCFKIRTQYIYGQQCFSILKQDLHVNKLIHSMPLKSSLKKWKYYTYLSKIRH